jgi:hypothetical protein
VAADTSLTAEECRATLALVQVKAEAQAQADRRIEIGRRRGYRLSNGGEAEAVMIGAAVAAVAVVGVAVKTAVETVIDERKQRASRPALPRATARQREARPAPPGPAPEKAAERSSPPSERPRFLK